MQQSPHATPIWTSKSMTSLSLDNAKEFDEMFWISQDDTDHLFWVDIETVL